MNLTRSVVISEGCNIALPQILQQIVAVWLHLYFYSESQFLAVLCRSYIMSKANFKLPDPMTYEKTTAHRALCGETLRTGFQWRPFGCWKGAPLRCCEWWEWQVMLIDYGRKTKRTTWKENSSRHV